MSFDMAICILCLKLKITKLFVYQCWFDVVCVVPSRVRCVSSDTADDTEAWRVVKHLNTFLTPAFEDGLLILCVAAETN